MAEFKHLDLLKKYYDVYAVFKESKNSISWFELLPSRSKFAIATNGKIEIYDHKGLMINEIELEGDMAKRTVENCSLHKQFRNDAIGTCKTINGKCEGYAGSDGDEPCSDCRECGLNVYYED